MTRLFVIALFAIFAASLPAVADAPVSDTVVSIPWGDMVAGILPALQTLVLGGILWVVSTIAPSLYGIMRTAQVEQVMTKALDFGFNSVGGAVKGQTLKIEIVNDVLREIVVYGLTHGGKWFTDFAGTPEEIAQKAYARLDLPPQATKPDFAAIADEAVAQVGSAV